MKRLILIVIGILFALGLSAQTKNDWQYVNNLYGGFTLGGTWNVTPALRVPNTVKLTNWTLSGTQLSLFNGATQYSVAVAPADQVTGIALADSSSGTYGEKKYATSDDLEEVKVSSLLRDIKAIGFNGVLLPMYIQNFLGGTKLLVDNYAYYTKFIAYEPFTATGVHWVESVTGNYTSDNYNGFYLYSVSAGVYTKIASTTNDTAEPNIWELPANTLGTKAFSSPVVCQPGVYAIALVYNASGETAAPTFRTHGSIGQYHNLMFTTNKIVGTVAGQNTLPDSEAEADITAGDGVLGIWIY